MTWGSLKPGRATANTGQHLVRDWAIMENLPWSSSNWRIMPAITSIILRCSSLGLNAEWAPSTLSWWNWWRRQLIQPGSQKSQVAINFIRISGAINTRISLHFFLSLRCKRLFYIFRRLYRCNIWQISHHSMARIPFEHWTWQFVQRVAPIRCERQNDGTSHRTHLQVRERRHILCVQPFDSIDECSHFWLNKILPFI